MSSPHLPEDKLMKSSVHARTLMITNSSRVQVSAVADFMVTGDSALNDVGRHKAVKIIRALDLLQMMQAE